MLKKTLVYLSLSTIFISSLHIQTPIGLLYTGYIILLISTLGLAHLNRWVLVKSNILIFLSLLTAASLLGMLIYREILSISDITYHAASMLAKITLLAFMAIAFYLVYRSCGKSALSTFEHYLKVATFFSWIGLLQEFTYILFGLDLHQFTGGTSKNYGYFIGVSGLSIEPAFYACSLLPAAAYYASEFVRNSKTSIQGIVTITAIILSTSSLGYLGVFLAAAISYIAHFKIKNLGIIFLTAPIVLFGSYKIANLDFFQMRLNDTLSVLKGAELTMAHGMNLSTYSNAVNTSISLRSLGEAYGTGPGFGMYSVVYDKYISNYEDPGYRDIPGRGSATSLFARLTAELGAVAFIIFIALSYWSISPIKNGYLTSISIAYLSTYLIILLRMGEYYINGVIPTFLMIYLIYGELKHRKQQRQNQAKRI